MQRNNVIMFYSGAVVPYHRLSNFYECDVYYNGLLFPSSEHAFQAQLFIEEHRGRFSKDGDLGKISGFKLLFKENEFESKCKWWMKKKNIGIIAKMAIKKAKQLRLKFEPNFTWSDQQWIELLFEKYNNNDELKELLLSTGDKYLLEFDRRAELRGSEFGGMLVDGKIIGNNSMGLLMMKVRDKLCHDNNRNKKLELLQKWRLKKQNNSD